MFLLCFAVTIVVTWQFYSSQLNKDTLRFQTRAEVARNNISSHLDMYVAMLRATAGLFAASEHIAYDEFKSYITRLELYEFYPGIQGIGLSLRIPPDKLDQFIQRQRREGQNSFNVWPMYQREEYHVITYLEPLGERNKAAIGYDMFTEPTRRAAMARARDTGMPAASGRVTLVQEIDVNVQAGFLIYVPVYKTGSVPETVEERNERLLGFVYSPFRAEDLLNSIFSGTPGFAMDIKVYDGSEPDTDRLLYTSFSEDSYSPDDFKPRFKSVRPLQVAGRTWTVIFTNQPEFEHSSSGGLAPVIFASGLFFSFLISAMTWLEARARKDSEMRAEWLHRSQEELSESQGKLLENDRRKDEFLAVLAHELRNPLAPIYNAIQIIKRSSNDPDAKKELTPLMESQVCHLIRLVDDLMDVSRITRGKIELRTRPQDIREIVNTSIDTVRSLIDERGQTLSVDLPDYEVPVLADTTRLSQVFANLLHNASKYTQANGEINLSVSIIGENVEINVQDNGIGIPEEKLDYIFEMFSQASENIRSAYGGLGIGLTLVKSFVNLHGGSIKVSSAGLGKGSTFTVLLPLYARGS